jgi:hypothetical protein
MSFSPYYPEWRGFGAICRACYIQTPVFDLLMRSDLSERSSNKFFKI